jgi:hypothetical protein
MHILYDPPQKKDIMHATMPYARPNYTRRQDYADKENALKQQHLYASTLPDLSMHTPTTPLRPTH